MGGSSDHRSVQSKSYCVFHSVIVLHGDQHHGDVQGRGCVLQECLVHGLVGPSSFRHVVGEDGSD